jgi:hypothetical protein
MSNPGNTGSLHLFHYKTRKNRLSIKLCYIYTFKFRITSLVKKKFRITPKPIKQFPKIQIILSTHTPPTEIRFLLIIDLVVTLGKSVEHKLNYAKYILLSLECHLNQLNNFLPDKNIPLLAFALSHSVT